ncbi:HAD family phosphatase [Bengtsoniella intestinalis]|uniref:HAD family hydrolase n=1 Tax=Bengtsoniella intestinalis TaxID=3073143 RepID=UPI00391F2A09
MFLFDLDGTLLDSNGVWIDVDRTFLARRNMEYSKAYYEGVAHTIFPLAAVFTKDFCQLEESCEEIMAEWMDLAKDAYAHVQLKPHVKDYLDQCKANGESMAIVTAAIPIHCQTALDHLGIAHYFDRITYAQELGLDKKKPDIWLLAAKDAGVSPADCTVFDDSFAACHGAKSAGMTTIGVYDEMFKSDTEKLRASCDRFILGFGELL